MGYGAGDFFFSPPVNGVYYAAISMYSIAFGLGHVSSRFTEQHHVPVYLVCICRVALKVGHSVYTHCTEIIPPFEGMMIQINEERLINPYVITISVL